MPSTPTRDFGQLEYDAHAVLEFPVGLPGFEDETRFALVERPAAAPLVFLQSLSRADLCFVAAPLSTVDPCYELGITREDLARLELDGERQPHEPDEVICLAILTAPERGALTANLLAPVVINVRTRRAVQAVRADSRYSHQHGLTLCEASC